MSGVTSSTFGILPGGTSGSGTSGSGTSGSGTSGSGTSGGSGPSTPPSACTTDVASKFLTGATPDYVTWLTSQDTAKNTLNSAPPTGADVPANLSQIISDLGRHQACLQEKLTAAQTASTTVATTQTNLATKDQAIAERKQDVQIAKDRAMLARFPERSRSYYDSWFPLYRPLKAYTVPLLIGLSVFFMMMSFFILMSIFKLDARILYYQFATPTVASAYTPWWKRGFFGAVLIIVALVGVVIYAFRR